MFFLAQNIAWPRKANTVEKSLVTSNLQLKLSAAPLLLPRWSVKAKAAAGFL